MENITPELLSKITKDFSKAIKTDKKYLRLYDAIQNGSSSWETANEYSIRVGELLANSINTYITPETLPNGRFYYNIADEVLNTTLRQGYEMIADATDLVQTAQNAKAKIGVKALRPSLDEDRIKGLIDKVSNAEQYEEVAWVMKEPIVNFSQSVVDDAIKVNAKFHAKAGLRVTVVRIAESGACKWCRAQAGTYKVTESAEIPHEVFQRHENCRCNVTYNTVKLRPYFGNTFRDY